MIIFQFIIIEYFSVFFYVITLNEKWKYILQASCFPPLEYDHFSDEGLNVIALAVSMNSSTENIWKIKLNIRVLQYQSMYIKKSFNELKF